MNRPFGAVDVAANLKGAIPKTAVQKILVSLAEKGELTQKTYGTVIIQEARRPIDRVRQNNLFCLQPSQNRRTAR